jgi:DnaD/phage-associated family protein
MTTIRVKKDARYFSASNEPFNDKRLSWEARGLMGYLLSKPDNWIVRKEDLEAQGPAGDYKLRRMLAELRKNGYMNRIRVTKEGGKFDWITEVYESPSQNPKASKGIVKASSGGKTTSGSSTSGKLPDITSTDLPSTEEIDLPDAQVFRALETLMGALPSSVTRYVDAWLEKHPLEWIFKAIDEAKAHNARSEKYVDKILIGWEANGYPKSRDEQVKEARKSPAAKQSRVDAGIAAFLAKHQEEQPHV